MLPTPYPEPNAVLKEMVVSIQRILRDNFIGAYLQGSFAVGDSDCDSDVDFLVALNEDLADAQVEALQEFNEEVSNHSRADSACSRWNLDHSGAS